MPSSVRLEETMQPCDTKSIEARGKSNRLIGGGSTGRDILLLTSTI